MFSLASSTSARVVHPVRPRTLWCFAGYAALVVLGLMTIAYVFLNYSPPDSAGSPTANDLTTHRTHSAVLRVHAIAGALALLLGLVQFFPRRELIPLRWHRWQGVVYAAAVLVSGAAGLWLARWADGGLPARVGFGALGLAWLGTTFCGVLAAIEGRVATHRRVMTYSFALVCASITLRLQSPLCAVFGLEFADYYPWVAWTCWVPNLVFAEFVLRRK